MQAPPMSNLGIIVVDFPEYPTRVYFFVPPAIYQTSKSDMCSLHEARIHA